MCIDCFYFSVTHNSVLISLLHLAQQLQYLHQVLLEATEYALSVFTGALVSMQSIHAVGDCVLGQLCSGSTYIVVIDIHHAELGLQLHSLGEQGDQLVQGLLCVGHGRVVDENDAVSVLLDGCPAFFILEVTASIPELDVDLAEVCHTWGRVSFEVDNSIREVNHSGVRFTCSQQ